MSSVHILLLCGLVGAGLDIGLHILQLSHKLPAWATRKMSAWLTLASCVLVGITLVPHFNLGAALIELFVGALAIYAIVTGKEVDH